ncbi:SAM-dependent methyltransferase [Nanobdella aerobiophila]|uniref:SAM-dependent methyltransferase n=2 Tax=Nanobdella aerobiophila TaxID=2586965 RepID=A0A915WRU2_9ARCH|nr:SAM-dependent methyltransferase [Nanobdella aerobiophila]
MICKYFNKCGGCQIQNLSYNKQIEYKINKFIEIFNLEPDEVIKSPKIFYYRNRMDYAVGKNYEVGLKEYKKWYSYIDIDECYLQSEESNIIRNRFRDFIINNKLEPWNNIDHTGFIRYIVIREGKFTNERMVNIVTSNTENIEYYKNIFLEFYKEIKKYVNSFYWTINNTISDVSYGDINYNLNNNNYIKEKALDNIYYISPNNFYQPNSYTAEILLKYVKELSNIKENDIVYDLYSGSGFYAIELSKYSNYVYAIDNSIENKKMFEVNKNINNIKNLRFLLSRVEDIEKISADKIIVDPPRSGLGKGVIKKIINSYPKDIIYISCYPETQKRDIDYFINAGYKINNKILIDQFPNTFHMETIFTLKK